MSAEIGSQSLADADVMVAAVAVSVAAWVTSVPARALLAVALGGWVLVPRRRARSAALLAVVMAAVACVSMMRGDGARAGLAAAEFGRYEGSVTVVGDPQPYARSTRVVVRIEGERFEIWGFGRGERARLHEWRSGDTVIVAGDRRPLPEGRAGRVAWQHVVGRYELEWSADRGSGTPLARMSNRVRGQIERAAEHLPAADGALYRGLVIGDDRDQPPEMIDRFRDSGLSHLTAVSGDNVR